MYAENLLSELISAIILRVCGRVRATEEDTNDAYDF